MIFKTKITIHVLRDDSIDLEFMKKKFATSTVAATGLEATQVVFPSDAVSIVGEDVLPYVLSPQKYPNDMMSDIRGLQ